MLGSLLQDLRYGLRMLVRNPGFSLTAIIALALGIGANTAIFSTVDALVLHPLNLPELDRLVQVSTIKRQQGGDPGRVAPADFAEWRERQTVFEEMAAYRWREFNLSGQGEPERIFGFKVTANFFQTLGAKPALGRAFLPEEEQTGRDRVVVITHNLWQNRFGADPKIVGAGIQLDGRNFTVIGVMPKDYDFPRPAALWAPIAMTGEEWNNRRAQFLTVVARLKTGVPMSQANAELDALADRQTQQFPQTNADRGALVSLLRDRVTGNYAPMFLWLLMGAVGFVLLIACVNIANMQLARAASRFKEFAVRAALGASRTRIIRQLLTESLLLSILGGLFGLLLSYWFLDLIRGSIPADETRFITGWRYLEISDRVIGFNLAIAFLSGAVFGLAPAFHISRPDLNETLKEGGRRSSQSGGHQRLRSLLVVSEVALALVLLVGSGFVVKGFARLAKDQITGFDPTGLLTIRTSLTESKYAQDSNIASFYERALERLAAMPGVASAGAVSYLPAGDDWATLEFHIEGRAPESSSRQQTVNYQAVSENYFETMRIKMIDGRSFSSSDAAEAMRVAVISKNFAQRYWPNEEPLGRRIKFGSIDDQKSSWFTVVGVADDVRRFMFDGELKPTVYVPYRQSPERTMYFALRTEGDPMGLVSAARVQIADIDPDLPLYEIKSQEAAIADQLSGVRLSAILMAIFGLMALLLSAIGVYGVISYTVSQRTHEMGIRIALGAQPRDVVRLVTGQAMKLVTIGLAIGIPAAFALGRLLSSVLFGVVSLDFAAFAGFTLLLTFVAFMSAYLPARRASKVDPIVALRFE